MELVTSCEKFYGTGIGVIVKKTFFFDNEKESK
jgi:hypothetical protein